MSQHYYQWSVQYCSSRFDLQHGQSNANFVYLPTSLWIVIPISDSSLNFQSMLVVEPRFGTLKSLYAPGTHHADLSLPPSTTTSTSSDQSRNQSVSYQDRVLSL